MPPYKFLDRPRLPVGYTSTFFSPSLSNQHNNFCKLSIIIYPHHHRSFEHHLHRQLKKEKIHLQNFPFPTGGPPTLPAPLASPSPSSDHVSSPSPLLSPFPGDIDECKRNNFLKAEEKQIRKYSPSPILSENNVSTAKQKIIPYTWRSTVERFGDRITLVEPHHDPPTNMTYKQHDAVWHQVLLRAWNWSHHKALETDP
ncbi:hypothetical protein L1987_45254 [Smallanthus sonchifolius]|uniref:Uncharacterized protein n=1 Tax=Smallanthus sonchifolius TaxID=185202 RepID=A0ACB9GRR4_9ASTR|nr:hypothetical protein L1987_45254 [Smallanthus sonchifolius]